MEFLEHPGLSRISALLEDLDVGDRILWGRLELFKLNDIFCFKEKKELVQKKSTSNDSPLFQGFEGGIINSQEGKAQQQDVEVACVDDSKMEECNNNFDPAARFGTSPNSTKLLMQLITTMNTCYPDYDFSSTDPEVFERIDDFVSVYSTINFHLSFLAERVIPGFLQDLWLAIKDTVDMKAVTIYSYTNASRKIDSDPYQDDIDCLFSFDYFFVDEKSHKVLFFSCMTKRKPYYSDPTNSAEEEQSDIQNSENSEFFESGDENDEEVLNAEIRYY